MHLTQAIIKYMYQVSYTEFNLDDMLRYLLQKHCGICCLLYYKNLLRDLLMQMSYCTILFLVMVIKLYVNTLIYGCN